MSIEELTRRVEGMATVIKGLLDRLDRLERGRPAARPRAQGGYKLSHEAVADIRRRYRPGTGRQNPGNGERLAREFGVARSYITHLVRNRK